MTATVPITMANTGLRLMPQGVDVTLRKQIYYTEKERFRWVAEHSLWIKADIFRKKAY